VTPKLRPSHIVRLAEDTCRERGPGGIPSTDGGMAINPTASDCGRQQVDFAAQRLLTSPTAVVRNGQNNTPPAIGVYE